jgi:F-type H+-transporting ATPase subunit b
MPQLDFSTFASQLIWLAITFVVLYVLMARIALPRIGDVLEARHDRIAHDLDAAGILKAEAEVALAAYEQSLAKSHSEAQAMLAQAAEERAREAAERQARIDTKIAGQLRDAEARIDEARQAAMAAIVTVAGDVARSATAKLIGVEPNDAAVEAALASAKGDG